MAPLLRRAEFAHWFLPHIEPELLTGHNTAGNSHAGVSIMLFSRRARVEVLAYSLIVSAFGGLSGRIAAQEPVLRNTFRMGADTHGVHSLAWTADGKLLAAGSFETPGEVWDVVSGRKQANLPKQPRVLARLAFEASGKLVAVGWRPVESPSVEIWELASGKQRPPVRVTIPGAERKVESLKPAWMWAEALSADGTQFAWEAGSGAITLWNVTTGKELGTVVGKRPQGPLPFKFGANGHTGEMSCLAFCDSKFLAWADNLGDVKVWDVATLRERISVKLPYGSGLFPVVNCIACTGDGTLLAVGHYGGGITLWELPKKRKIATLEPTREVRALAFDRAGKLLASGCSDRDVNVWEIRAAGPKPVTRER
jgi:WD40 repeat protein